MIKILVLVCAVGQAPWECQRPTARDVLWLETVSNEIECMRESEQTMARAAALVGPDGYLKVVCERTLFNVTATT